MYTFKNASSFDTHRTVQKDGRTFLVAKSVPIVEGVLNKFLVPMEEFASFTKDWNGVPIVLRHPKQNDGSARVPTPDVPVIGNFYGAFLDSDNRRLLGEYWFDETALLATNEGKDIYDAILAGKVIETSTGYYANIEDTPGVHKGLSYMGIQRNIHPDHIAVLPDEVGACSIRDGCGINRNSAAFQNCESCPCKTDSIANGGSGSGNYGHKGRPGEKGGSGKGSGRKSGEKSLKEQWDSLSPKQKKEFKKIVSSTFEDYKKSQVGKEYKDSMGRTQMTGSRITAESDYRTMYYYWKTRIDYAKELGISVPKDVLADYAEREGLSGMDAYMNFSLSQTLFENMTGNLPAEGKKIYEAVYKKAIEDGDTEETASKKAWGACKKAGWHKKGDEWVKKNYAIFENASNETPDFTDSSMIAFMLPEDVKEKIKAAFPFIEDDTYNNLHLTLAFLGDTETTDTIKALKAMFDAADYFPIVKGNIQGLARFISGGEQDAFVLTFDSPDMPKLHERLSNALEWKGVSIPKDHGFIPHITIAYIGAEDEIPADTFDPIEMTVDHIALVNGNNTFLTVPLWQDDQQRMGEVARNSTSSPKPGNWLVTLLSKFNKENKPMDKFKELVQKILNEAGWKVVFNDANQTASATPNSAPASPTLTGLESVVNEMGGVDKFAEIIKNMANLPAQIQALSEQMNGISGDVKAAQLLAQNAAQAAESEKKDIAGRLIANGSCPLPEAVLNTLALDDLKKLESSYQPTNYAALGAFVTNTNAGGGAETPLGLPSYFETAEVN